MPSIKSNAKRFDLSKNERTIRIFYLHIIMGVNVPKAGLANPILLFPYIRLEDDFCCLGSVTVICRLPFLGWAA